MNKIVSFLLALFLVALIAVSCSKDETTGPDENNVIVPNTTEVVETENANTDISLVVGDSLYVDPESDLADLEVGDIILTDVNNYAPEGLLKKITAKNYIGNSIQFETEQASLAEAVEQLSLSETFHLTPSRVRSVEVFHRSQYKSSRDDDEFMIDIDCPLYDQDGNLNTTNDQIALSGDLSFTADIFTDIDISLFSLQQFEIGIESNREANLYLNANLQWEFDDELTFELAQFNFTPITFFAGPVPIVITPELVVEAHVHGDLTVTFTTGVSYSEDVRYGVGYENEAWYQIKESSKTFSYTPPQISTEFNFETGASLRLNTFLYGVGGPYVKAKAGFEFQSVLITNPSEMHLDFTLDAMLYSICGLYMEVLDHTILNESIEFNIYTQAIGAWEIPLAANNPPNSPSNPNPANNATSVSTTTDLSWSCTDPDGDPLTYDVYFGISSNPSLVNSGQSDTSYDLGALEEETTYYWKIIAHDDHSQSTGGAVWQFTTQNGSGSNQPPNQPSSPNPADNATSISINTNISWSCTDPNGDPLTYDVYFGTDPTPDAGELVSENQIETSYTIDYDLEYEEDYYWKIVASDNEYETESEIWQFTTELEAASPSNPILVGHLTFDYGCAIIVQNNLAYIAANYDGLLIIDVSEPSDMQIIGQIDTDQAKDLVLINDYIYIADDSDGLKVIDVSNPNMPLFVSMVLTDEDTGSIAFSGNTLLVGEISEDVNIFDISNPELPVLISEINTENVQDIFILNSTAYIVENHLLDIYDLSTPSGPNFLGSYYNSSTMSCISVFENNAYLGFFLEGIQILNIVNPSEITLIGENNQCDCRYDMSMINNFIFSADYISGSTDNEYFCIDVSIPQNPQVVSDITTDYNCLSGVYANESYVYYVGSDGLLVFQIGE